jgi:thioesterase domain-containing protein
LFARDPGGFGNTDSCTRLVGWSLGGLVALEISHIELSQQKQHASGNANLQILGLVLIDSVFPHPMDVPPTVESVNYAAEFEDHVTPETRAVVQYAMEQTDRLIEEWQPPSWEAEQPTPARGDTGDMPSGAPKATNTLTPPPAMLLRAREPVPPPPQTKPGIKRVIDVDLTRERRFLGWEDYKTKFIRNVLDVNGHHHNIFKDHNVSCIPAVFPHMWRICCYFSSTKMSLPMPFQCFWTCSLELTTPFADNIRRCEIENRMQIVGSRTLRDNKLGDQPPVEFHIFKLSRLFPTLP